jgi:molybdopterin synthase sulfur carrier subunit
MNNEPIGVKVKFFAAPREALGVREIEMEVPPATTVAGLIDLLKEEYPVLRAYTRFLSIAINRAYVGMQTVLQDGDEVACLPPVGGG